MTNNTSKSHPTAASPSYVWEYEYYDDVSFENLKAHRYSIVICFWVGLAVFVIFMFFILTLLTKTGAPHQESQYLCETRCHPASCLVSIGRSRESDSRTYTHPPQEESRSLIHCFLHEEDPGEAGQGCFDPMEAQTGHSPKKDPLFLTHFNIPNSVDTEHSSALGDDDLLLGDPPEILHNRNHHDI